MGLLERIRQTDYLPKRDRYAESKRSANQFAQEYIAAVAEQMLQTGVLDEHQEVWMRNLSVPPLKEIQQVQAGTIPILHLGDRERGKNPNTILIWQPTFNGQPLALMCRRDGFEINTLILPESPKSLRNTTHIRDLHHLNTTVEVELSEDNDVITLAGNNYYYLGETTFQEHRPFHSWIRIIKDIESK